MTTEAILCIIVGVCMVADIVTGLCQAIKNKTFKSSKMREGLWHKCSFVFIIALSFGIEYATKFVDIGFTLPLIVPVSLYIVANEISSILENIVLINPELKTSPIFSLFHNKHGDNKDE